jgi:hypothetical protein
MKKLFLILLLAALVIPGCSLAVKQAHDIDLDLSAYLKDNALTRDCRAGIADAFILAPDTSADIRIAAQATSQYADKTTEDYKDCFSKGAWISFVARGVASKGKKLLGTIATMGVLVP